MDDVDVNIGKWKILATHVGVPNLTFKDFVDVDNDTTVYSIPTDEEIFQSVQGTVEEDDDCDYNIEIPSQPSSLLRKATLALDIVRHYLKFSGVNEQLFTYFNRGSHEIMRRKLAQNLRQTNINQYVSL